jgi:hypothetical protein
MVLFLSNRPIGGEILLIHNNYLQFLRRFVVHPNMKVVAADSFGANYPTLI